jgi:hypothetical protein
MNVLDRAIELVAPKAALRRAQARAVLTLTQDFMGRHAERFSYDGAAAGRRVNSWIAPSTDANVELMGSLVWLRNRSRDLVRNNPYAVKAVEELVGNAVGTGIVPQAKTGSDAIDKIIDAEWPYFVEACDTPQRLDFYGMQALILRTMAESGESIVRYRPRLPQDNLRVPLQLQLLEADFLDHARTMGTVNGHIMQGVQFDLLGRRVAYWIYTYHPGGMLIMNPRGGILSVPVPADQILHSYQTDRLAEKAGPKTINDEVLLLLRLCGDQGDLIRARLRREKAMKLPTPPSPGRAYSSDEKALMLAEAAKLRSKNMYPALVLDLNCGLRDKELRELRWRQIDLVHKKQLTVGKSKTEAGTGRVIPLNETVLAALQAHAAWYIRRFKECKPEWYVFPAGQAQPNDPTRPVTSLKTAWIKVRKNANVVGRWHDTYRAPGSPRL